MTGSQFNHVTDLAQPVVRRHNGFPAWLNTAEQKGRS
jgi:hypothetical protein